MEIGVVTAHSGRHFLQIPGPTNVPDRVLHAIAQPTIDHRGPDFAELARDVLRRVKPVFGTSGPVVIYPSSGTGAWEAALVNTLSPGDRVLAFETGHFATLWREMAERLGLVVDFVAGDWRRGVDPAAVAERLTADTAHSIAAGVGGHNENPNRGVHPGTEHRGDRRHGTQHRGGDGGSQRDLDRGRQPSTGHSGGRRRGGASRAPAGRHDLLAGVHRLPA